LQTIRSARNIFYELDDYYREIKRNFSNKSKNEIMDIRKIIGVLDDKLRNLPPKNHSGDIEFYCRDAPSALFFSYLFYLEIMDHQQKLLSLLSNVKKIFDAIRRKILLSGQAGA
jgi:hypothetical protein